MRARPDLYRSWITDQITERVGSASRPFFEEIIEQIYRELAGPGDLVVDGGANHGIHTLPLSELVGPDGEVLAVEAVPALADALSATLAAAGRGNTRVARTAIGAAAGTASFTWVKGALDGYSGLRKRDMPDGADDHLTVIEVPVTTLDALLAQRRKPVRLIKLDLEGGEFDALRGAMTMLAEDRPVIVFENGREGAAKLYGYRREDWFGLFDRLGYNLFDLFGRPFGPSQWEAPDVPWYYVAVAAGSADEAFVRDRLYDRIALLHLRLTTEALQAALERGVVERAGLGVRNWLRRHPRLRDLARGVKRRVAGKHDPNTA